MMRRVMPAQLRVLVLQAGAAAAQLFDQRPQVRGIKGGHGIGGGRTGQAREIQASAEIAAALDEAQRPCQGLKEREEQPQDQLVGMKFGIAVRRQLPQTLQVLLEQSRCADQRQPLIIGVDLSCQRPSLPHSARLCHRQGNRASQNLANVTARNAGRFWRGAHATIARERPPPPPVLSVSKYLLDYSFYCYNGRGRTMPEFAVPKLHHPPPPPAAGNLEPQDVGQYAEFDVVTNFCFLRGASHPDELIYRATELGYKAIAITDINSLAGIVRAFDATKQVTEQGGHPPKLIIGKPLNFTDRSPDLL